MTSPPQATTSPRARKRMLLVHIAFAASWVGATVAMTFLSITGLFAGNPETRRAAYLIMSIMDRNLIVPLVISSIVSGLVLALRTPWGVFRYYWVMAKLGLTLSMVALAVVAVIPLVQTIAAASTDAGALAAAESMRWALVAAAGVFIFMLCLTLYLAMFKPWGRTSRV